MHTRTICQVGWAFSLALTSLAAAIQAAESQSPWWDSHWRYRTTVARATPYRGDARRPVEAAIDFPLLLETAGVAGRFDPASLRVIRCEPGGGLVETPFAHRRQYDARPGRPRSYLAWIAKPLEETLGRYDIYFDTKDRGIEPAAYEAQRLPPENLAANGGFESLTGGRPSGWAISPGELARTGDFSATTGRRSLAIVVDGDTPAGGSREATISQRIDVRRYAGGEMLFECDLLAERAAYGAPISIELEQYRGDGSRIPQFAVEPRWLTLELAQGQLVQLSQRGRFHPEAATVNLRIRVRCSVRDADTGGRVTGAESYFTVWLDRVVVRPGERWDWPGRSGAGFVQGAIDSAPRNRAFQFTGRRRVAWNGASESTLTDGRYNPNPQSVHWGLQAGTLEFWCRPLWNADDGREHIFYQGVAHGHRLQSQLRKLGEGGGNRLVFTIADSGGALHRAGGPAALRSGRWSHIAAVWDFPHARLGLFVDGKLVAQEGPGARPWPSTTNPQDKQVGPGMGVMEDDRRSLPMQAFLGGDRDCDPGLSAESVVDELRISDTPRYDRPFAAQRREFPVDQHTRALFHFENSVQGVHASDDRRVRGSLACELSPYGRRAPLEIRNGKRIERRWVLVAPPAPESLFEKNRVENRLVVTRPFDTPPDPRFVELRLRQVERTVRDTRQEFSIDVGGDCEPLMSCITFEHADERSARTTRLPRWRANDNVSPFNFQDLAATLAPDAKTDAEKAFRVFQYALATTNYYDAHICETLPTRNRPRVSYSLCKALNIYAFDQCGPLNYMLRKLFLAAGVSSNDASGTHHQFEQAYYDGDFRLFDLSPRRFWLLRDNATVASRRDFEEDLYLKLRQGIGVTSGIPGRVSRARFGSAERPHDMTFPLRAGEKASFTWRNEGRWIELTEDRRPTTLSKIPPYFGNGAIVFQPVAESDAIRRDNLEVIQTSDGETVLRADDPTRDASMIYRAACPYVFADASLAADYRSRKPGAVTVSLSLDEGEHWSEAWRSDSANGRIDRSLREDVMARFAYWLRLELAAGSHAEVAGAAVRSVFVVSPLALPGRLSLGANRIQFVGGPVDSPVKTTCRWVERYRSPLAASLNGLCYYLNGDQMLRRLFVVSPAGRLPVELTLEGSPLEGEASIDQLPRGWTASPAKVGLRLTDAASSSRATFQVRPGPVAQGDIAALRVAFRSGGHVRYVAAHVLIADAPLLREAEGADAMAGSVEPVRRAELSGGAAASFRGDGTLTFDTSVQREDDYALWLRARWEADHSTNMSLQVDGAARRTFSATAMIGFTDWDDPRHAHTKMFAHFGEQYGHWAWYRLPDVPLAAGRHRLSLGAGAGAQLDAVLLLPQTPRMDRASMNLLLNWNYAPEENPL